MREFDGCLLLSTSTIADLSSLKSPTFSNENSNLSLELGMFFIRLLRPPFQQHHHR